MCTWSPEQWISVVGVRGGSGPRTWTAERSNLLLNANLEEQDKPIAVTAGIIFKSKASMTQSGATV